jgi:RNA polymerase sigma factor (sigma-70 family)
MNPVKEKILEELERIFKHRYPAPILGGSHRIAVREAYTKLLELEQERGTELPPEERIAYLKRVAKNKILDEIQRHHNDDQIYDKNTSKKKNNRAIVFGDDEKNKIDKDIAVELLGRLTPEHSEVLRMHYIEGCTIKQIAEKIGLSVDGVKKRLKNAKKEALALWYEKRG